MKFTIMGFSQKKLMEFGLDLDEALILRWFIDYRDTESGKIVSEIIENDKYYWFRYQRILDEQLPILNVNKQNFRRKLKKLCDCGVLKHYTKRKEGTYSYYTIGENYIYLIDESAKTHDKTDYQEGRSKMTEGSVKNDRGGRSKMTEGYVKNDRPKKQSIKTKIYKIKKSIKQQQQSTKKDESLVEDFNINEDTDQTNKQVNEVDPETIEIIQQQIEQIGPIKKSAVENLIQEAGTEKIKFYLANFHKFTGNKDNPVGYFISAVKENWKIPTEQKASYKSDNNSQKPIQSTNFEQREYEDEYFESLYANNPYEKKSTAGEQKKFLQQ